MAALAGMSRATFDKAIADTALRDWILAQQDEADRSSWNIDATPSFVINGTKNSGEMSYDAFAQTGPRRASRRLTPERGGSHYAPSPLVSRIPVP